MLLRETFHQKCYSSDGKLNMNFWIFQHNLYKYFYEPWRDLYIVSIWIIYQTIYQEQRMEKEMNFSSVLVENQWLFKLHHLYWNWWHLLNLLLSSIPPGTCLNFCSGILTVLIIFVLNKLKFLKVNLA